MNISQSNPSDPTRLTLLTKQIRFEGRGINSYEFVDPDGHDLPPFSAGAHIDILLEGGHIRQYSLCNSPLDRHRYVIAVLCDEKGRGGSKLLHQTLRVQDKVTVSAPRNNFALADQASKVILLAGGIGITPLKSMAHQLAVSGVAFDLHYCAKDSSCAAFGPEITGLGEAATTHFHYDRGNPADGLDIAGLLRQYEDGVHLYYCGPPGFMKACQAASAHWPSGSVHFEHFQAPSEPQATSPGSQAAGPDGSFTVQLSSTGETLRVAPEQSLVDALADAGKPIETSCVSGLCGTCKVHYLSGDVDHRDFILSDEEHKHYLTACVSRARSGVVVLDL